MLKILSACLVLSSGFFSTTVCAEKISETDALVTYKAADEFEMVKENMVMAITNQGLKVSGYLHIAEMMQRTAKDLGFNNVFHHAESIEFCSALMSHRMVQLDPANAAVCPFTINIYSKADSPEQVYVSVRKIYLQGDDDKAKVALNQKINQWLDAIVVEGLDE